MEPCALVPERLVAFSEAVHKADPTPGTWVHFYEDDYKFERLWREPERHFDLLTPFDGVISPDFSLYRNMSGSCKIWNTYRSYLLGAAMQARGMKVIVNVRLSGRKSIPYALAGVPPDSTLAIGLHGCTKSVENRGHVLEEVRTICDECQPANLVVYGSSRYGVLDYPVEQDIPVYEYKPDAFTRSRERRSK
jgi:hypothetical protein